MYKRDNAAPNARQYRASTEPKELVPQALSWLQALRKRLLGFCACPVLSGTCKGWNTISETHTKKYEPETDLQATRLKLQKVG